MIKKIISNYVNSLEIEKEEKIILKIQLLYDFFQDDYFKETYKNISILTIDNYPSIVNPKIEKMEGTSSTGFERFVINFNYPVDNKMEEELDENEEKIKNLYLNEENYYQLNKLRDLLKKTKSIESFKELLMKEFEENNNFLNTYFYYYDSEMLNNLLSYLGKDNKINNIEDKEYIRFRNIRENKNTIEFFNICKEELENEINKFKLKRISKFYEKDDIYNDHLNEIKKIFNHKKEPELFIFQDYSKDNELFLKDINIMEDKDKLKLYDNKVNLFYNNSQSSIYKGLSYGKESSYNAGSDYSKLYIGFHNGLELIGLLQATSKRNFITITSVCVSQNYRGQKLVQSMYDNLYQIAEKANKVITTIEYSNTGVKKLPFLREKMKEKYPNILHINEGYDRSNKEDKNNKDYLIKGINESIKNLLHYTNIEYNLKNMRQSYDLMLKDIDNSQILLSENYYILKHLKNFNFNKDEKNESRNDFLKRINNGEKYITLEIEGSDECLNKYNNRYNNENFQNLFNKIKFNDQYQKFFEDNNIKDLYGSILPKIELDYYELEDNQKVVFNVTLNLNELYDIYKEQYKTEYIEVYRVEGKNGEGLYQQPLRIENNENRPAPHLDGNISLIFNDSMTDNDTYKKQYIFGFKNLIQLNEWMKDVDMSNLSIKKYRVPDYYVVEGNKQVIFKKDESEFIQNIDILELNKKIKIKIK